MFKPSSRVVPVVIGISAATTLALDVAVLLGRSAPPTPASASAPAAQPVSGRFLAAAQVSPPDSDLVAPLKNRLTPTLLVAAPASLSPATVTQVGRIKGVRGVEAVDAAQTMLAGKRVSMLGVEPSTFRNYTPKPTAESDPLWRNVAAGDIAVSFTLGTDGGANLGSRVPVNGATSRNTARIGALATMGMGEIDAVVSRRTARGLGMPIGNALVISAPKDNLDSLERRLHRILPKKARIVRLVDENRISPAPGGLPDARGQVLTALQIRTAIQAAQSKLGMPYVWGGESDAEGGYDCSGILQYAFGKAGVRLPRVADDQAKAGWRIPFDKARPGDLLTWAHDPTAPGYISHIALYLGDGKMLAAPRRGTVVRIQPVYFRNFQGAIRINPRLAARLAG